jgi:hypothetical protein
MPFRQIPTDLQNLPSQVAMEAYARMSPCDHALVDTDYPMWREIYDNACRGVLRGEPRPERNLQLSLPFERQA